MSQTYRIGTLNFTGSRAVLSSSLDVSGSGRFTDGLIVTRSLYITGSEPITFSATGDVFEISGSFDVYGNSTLEGSIDVKNRAIVSGSLDVSGSGRFTDTLTLSNPSTALSAFGGTLTLIQEGGSRYLNLFNGGIRYNSTYTFYIGNGTVNGFTLSADALTASIGNSNVYTLNLTYNDNYRYTISKGVGGADLPNYLDIRTDDYTSGFDYGPVPSPIIRIYSGNNTAVNSSGGFGDLILQHNGTSARGNVLIGTSTTSSFKLDVSGSGRFTNGLYLSGPENHITTASARIQGNSIVTQFDSNGGDSGYVGGYDFRVSSLRNPTTSSFRIWGGVERTKVGVGDFTEGNLQAVDAKLLILNDTSESNGRNAGIRLLTKEHTTSTTYNGIRMDAFPLGDGNGGGGAFIGTQTNPANNGYDSDLVILATSATVNSHREIARFVGKSGSLSLGEFPTKNPVATLDVSGSVRITDVLTLPFQDPLPSGKATGSIALSGSGATFVGMFVYNGTNWVTV